MTFKDALRELLLEGIDLYCAVGVVSEVDEVERTCTVTPEDEAPIHGCRLQASEGKKLGFCMIPKDKSYVAVAFANKSLAFVVIMDEVEKILFDTDSVIFNGGKNGGLTNTPELATQLKKQSARIDGIINAIKNGVPIPQDGGVGLQNTIVIGLESIADKEDFSKIEDKKITH